MKQEKKTDISLVKSALADDFSMHVENLTRIDERGDNSEAFSAEYEGKKIIIKIIENDMGFYMLEYKVLEVLRNHGIPVAVPLAYEEKASHLGQSIFVQTAVPGKQLSRSPLQESPEIYEDIGQMLKKIHEIKLPGFGKLEISDGQLKGQSVNWRDSLSAYHPNKVSYIDAADYLQEHGFINSDEVEKIKKAIASVSEIELPQASLLHNDVQPAHIFTDGKKITGLIDMGGVSAGDPRFDIAKTHYYLNKRFWLAFDKGYGELTQDSLIDDYLLINSARKLVYRHKNNYTARIPKAIEMLKECLSKS